MTWSMMRFMSGTSCRNAAVSPDAQYQSLTDIDLPRTNHWRRLLTVGKGARELEARRLEAKKEAAFKPAIAHM